MSTLTAVAAPAKIVGTIECDEFACRTANTHRDTCRCACQGDGHGRRFMATYDAGRARLADRIVRQGGVFANLPTSDDEAF